jgi:Carboxypeptidase regulatory-like domain
MLYSLQARKPGFLEDPTRRLTVSPDTDISIALLPEAVIRGRVMTSDTDAAAGITVELFNRQVQEGLPRWVRSDSAKANSNGEFRFADLMPGTYKVMTRELLDTESGPLTPNPQFYGFPPMCFPGVVDFAEGTPIQLTAGQTFDADIPLSRQPYFRVQIPVTNIAAAYGLNVRVSAQGHPGPGYSLGYNFETERIEGLLPKGNYLVEATSFGPVPGSGSANLAVTGAVKAATAIEISPDAEIPVNVKEEFTSNNWDATPCCFLSGGHAFALHGGPRTYLDVSLEPADEFEEHGWAGLRPPLSANDNALVIEHAGPGRYWVRIHTSRGYVASATSGNIDLLQEALVVAAGGSSQIDITVRDDTGKIDGTVLGLRNTVTEIGEQSVERPNPGMPAAYIYCVPLAGNLGQFQQFTVSSDGRFNSQEMPPGAYRLLAFDRPQPSLPYRDAEAMRAYESQGQVVRLIPGQTEHVQLQLISGSN